MRLRQDDIACLCGLAEPPATELRRRSSPSRDSRVVSWLGVAFQSAADQFTDVVNRLRGKAVAVDFQILQIFRQSHLKSQDLELQIGPLQHWDSATTILCFNQRFQKVIQSSLDAFTKHESVIAGELSDMMT